MKFLEALFQDKVVFVYIALFVLFLAPAFCGGPSHYGDSHQLDAQPDIERRVR